MRRKREIDGFNIAFLDLLTGALGAVIILFITVPKNEAPESSTIKTEATCTIENKLLNKCMTQLRDSEKVITKERMTVMTQKEIIKKLQKEIKEKNESSEIKTVSNTKSKTKELDVGFTFKGKNIVFLIDISGSMSGEKIGQVKAGLKMLIASMGKAYKVDIVHFPNQNKGDYYSLWGQLQSVRTLDIKHEIYNFLSRLKPQGFTPTRSALLYTLRQYPEMTDIVLLSDGSPTIPGTRKRDDYKQIIKEVSLSNIKNVQINTIGVGEKTYSTNSTLHKFLSELSKSSKGFFYGF